MDDQAYQKAGDLKHQMNVIETERVTALIGFDAMVEGVSVITDPEWTNMTASMRSTLNNYFDRQVAPLTEQFSAL